MEVLNQIIIAKELNFIKEKNYQTLRTEVEKISNKLNALRKAQLNKSTIKQYINGRHHT